MSLSTEMITIFSNEAVKLRAKKERGEPLTPNEEDFLSKYVNMRK